MKIFFSVIWVLYFVSFNSGLGGASSLSPYVFVSFLFFSIFLIKIVLADWGARATFWQILLGCFFVLFCIGNFLINGEPVVTFVRNIFLFVSLAALRFVNSRNSRKILDLFLFLLISELIIRFITGRASFSSSIYTYKNSVIFPDTNFLGVVFSFLAVYFVRYGDFIKRFSSVLLIFMTASRTAWISFGLLILVRKPRAQIMLSLMVLILPPVLFKFILSYSDLDGSLGTKIDILHGFILVSASPADLIFGLGKNNSLAYLQILLGDSVHVGHTIYGNFVQYGIGLVLSYIFFAYGILEKNIRNGFLLLICFSGASGLFPFAFIPMIAVIVKAISLELRKKHV